MSLTLRRTSSERRLEQIRWAAVTAVLLVPFVLISRVATAESGANDERTEAAARNLQRVVDGMRERLGIDRAVVVTFVAANPYHVSVEPPAASDAAFVVEMEEAILDLLTEDEIEATLAHELGHVWVFTHHPYLQTELLANQVAMRAVSRDALTRVYEKVWRRGGLKGDLTLFLGAQPRAVSGGPDPQ